MHRPLRRGRDAEQYYGYTERTGVTGFPNLSISFWMTIASSGSGKVLPFLYLVSTMIATACTTGRVCYIARER